MSMNEEAKLAWIRKHVHINHDELSSTEASWWFELMEADFLTFVRYAIYGFTLRLEVKAHMKIPGDVMEAFIKEFKYKICLAVTGDSRVPALPLFAVTGLELIGEESKRL